MAHLPPGKRGRRRKPESIVAIRAMVIDKATPRQAHKASGISISRAQELAAELRTLGHDVPKGKAGRP